MPGPRVGSSSQGCEAQFHGPAIKRDVSERGRWQDIGDGSEGREFARCVASEGGCPAAPSLSNACLRRRRAEVHSGRVKVC
jgi:hypothetical protein